MGGGKTKSSSTQALTPNNDVLLGNASRSQTFANTAPQAYGGAPLDLSQSMGAARGLLDFQAPNVAASSYAPSLMNRSDVRDVTTGAATPEAIKGYYDPYENDVIGGFLGDNERQRQMAIQAGQSQATAAGAFGGSRHGVADSLTNGEYARVGASTSAGLRSQGFQTALGAAQADLGRRLSADQGNQGFDFGISSGNAGFRNTADQFNAGQTQAAAIANQRASIDSAGVQAQGAGLLGQFEGQQFGSAYADWERQQQEALQRQQIANQAYGLLYGGPLTTAKSSGWQFTPPNVQVG